MTLYAKPNLNGNSVEDFKKAYYSLSHVEDQIGSLIGDMRQFVIHGRNYQHLDGQQAEQALSMDGETLLKIKEAMSAIEALKRGIEVAVTEQGTKQ